MSLTTLSAWNFGHTITSNNQAINFSELADPTELLGNIAIRDYTLGEFGDAIASAMNEVANQEYTVTLDRATRIFTISAPANFELLVTTGTQTAISAFALMGFTTDRSGSNSYVGDVASGDQYITQYLLQNYVDFEDDEQANASTVNTSASGDIIEVVQFGTQNRMRCVMPFISDRPLGFLNRTSTTGVSEAREFLRYITTKARIEFLPDVTDENTFTKCILDSNASSRDGTGYRLQLDYTTDIFSTGELVFLRVR
jgi:hypothetical protein